VIAVAVIDDHQRLAGPNGERVPFTARLRCGTVDDDMVAAR